MNPFFAYLIKSSISLALLYILFRLLTRNDKSHLINRFLLLGILFVSAIIPFLNIQFFYEELPIKQVEVFREFVSAPVFFADVPSAEIKSVQESKSMSINPFMVFYLLVIIVLLSRLLVSVLRVFQIIQQAEKQRFRKIFLAVVKDFIQPFSFLNKIVISKKDYTENKDIVVTHEHAHIKQLHAIDLVVCEIFSVLHFFNPFMWFLRHDLKLVHEYQADQAVLNKGIDAKKYQLLVLQKSVGERRFAMANHFRQKPILKRLKMMQKKNKKQWAALKLILFVPVLILLLQAFARPDLITTPNDFIPVKTQENEAEKWLERWTVENIGKGFFQPGMKSIDSPKKPNNVLVILLNRNNQFLIENEIAKKEDVKPIVKQFLSGQDRKGKLVVDYIEKEIPFVGKMIVSKGFISFRHDLDSSEETINFTLRSIGEACLEVRKEKAQILFGDDYFALSDEKQQAVNMAIPVWFLYEDPKTMKPPPPPPSKKESESIRVHLNKNKLNFKDKFCNVEDLKFMVDSHIKENPDIEVVELVLHQPDALSKEIVAKVKRELEGVENVEIKERTVIVMDIKKNVPPPPPMLIKLEKDRRIICGELNFNYEQFDAYLKKTASEAKKAYENYSKNLELMATVNWDTEVGYQGIHKLAKILDKHGIKKVEFNPVKPENFVGKDENKEMQKPPPPPPPKLRVYLYKDKITLWDEVNSKKTEGIETAELSKTAKEFLSKVGKYYTVTIYKADGVSEERVNELKEKIFIAGLKNVNVLKMR